MGDTSGVAEAETAQGETPVPAPGLTPRSKLWLEVDGRIALSEWRVALLEAVEAAGSLAAAAEQIGVPYRTATYKLREIETSLGVRLVATRSGGATGGGSHLTPEAREYIRRWRAFSADLDAWVAAHFHIAFETP
jgi:molybdate transport system regulatory protein